MELWTQLAMEQFSPRDIVRQAAESERAGFDAVNVSDHFQPWWEPGHSGNAWVTLGACAFATDHVRLGTGVTAPVHRYNPAVVAQSVATLEELAPGRAFLGIGSGEALNEVPTGMEWPSVREQVDRMAEALEIITRLLDGERLDFEGRFYRTRRALLHTLPERRPPVYVSAFGPRAAGVAARFGDGLWTIPDPDRGVAAIDAYRKTREELGKDAGEIILQVGFSWAEDDDAAFEGARVWKGAQPPEFFTHAHHEPQEMYRRGEEWMSDEEFAEAFIISSDPKHHVERIERVMEMGPTVICLQNASGADPDRALAVYGAEVLPALRRVAAPA